MQKELEEPDQLNVKADLHYISKNWFAFKEDRFELAKKISSLIENKSRFYINTSIFMEYSFVIFSYFSYINNFNDFKEYNKYSHDEHHFYGNQYIIQRLNERLLMFD